MKKILILVLACYLGGCATTYTSYYQATTDSDFSANTVCPTYVDNSPQDIRIINQLTEIMENNGYTIVTDSCPAELSFQTYPTYGNDYINVILAISEIVEGQEANVSVARVITEGKGWKKSRKFILENLASIVGKNISWQEYCEASSFSDPVCVKK